MLFVLGTVICTCQAYARSPQMLSVINRADTLSISVRFPQASSVIDRSFHGNGATLDEFTSAVNRLNADSTAFVNAVKIAGSASPEGSVSGNERLARQRAEAIRDYILEHTTLSPAQIRLRSVGADWDSFRRMMLGGNHPYKDEIIGIIDTPFPYAEERGVTVDRRLAMLKALDSGRVWDYLMQGPFTRLRQAGGDVTCIVTYLDAYGGRKSVDVLPSRTDTLVIMHKDTVYNNTVGIIGIIGEYTAHDSTSGKTLRTPKRFRRDSLFRVPVLALRSNLLVPAMNLGIEVPLGNRWSLEADYFTPWAMREWVNSALPPFKYCFEWQSACLGARLWFGRIHSNRKGDARYRFLGHSMALYGAWARYDLGRDYHGQQGDAWAAGLDYKYSFPLGRRGGTHLEFTIGGGIYYDHCRDYNVPAVIEDGMVMLQDSDPKLIGDGPARQMMGLAPFKAGISLVVPIWKKNSKGKD